MALVMYPPPAIATSRETGELSRFTIDYMSPLQHYWWVRRPQNVQDVRGLGLGLTLSVTCCNACKPGTG